MALKAQIHSCTAAYIQKYPQTPDQPVSSFATLNITDKNDTEIIAFLTDPALARLIAERALEIADFLEEERAVAAAVKAAKEQLQQTRMEN